MWNPFRKKATHQTPTSEEIRGIIHSYGTLLEDQSKPDIMDESQLPASKEEIKKALLFTILNAPTAEKKEAYKVAYVFLSSFLPSVGSKGVDLSTDNPEALHWMEKMDEEAKKLEQELETVEKKLSHIRK